MSPDASRRMGKAVALGRAIRQHVEQADLEAASRLAAERHQQLRDLFADPTLDAAGESLATCLQEILREDQDLVRELAELRQRMELQLGAARRSARGAREYVAVAENSGGSGSVTQC